MIATALPATAPADGDACGGGIERDTHAGAAPCHCYGTQAERVAALLYEPRAFARLVSHARRVGYGLDVENIAADAAEYVFVRAKDNPREFASKSDNQVVGLALQKIVCQSIDVQRRTSNGASKELFVHLDPTLEPADEIDLLIDDMCPEVTPREVVHEVYTAIEQRFDTSTGIARFVSTIEKVVAANPAAVQAGASSGDMAAARAALLELVASQMAAYRLAPEVAEPTPVPRTVLAQLQLMLENGDVITAATSGLDERAIVRGLAHIWDKTTALAGAGLANPTAAGGAAGAPFPPKALVVVGLAHDLPEAAALIADHLGAATSDAGGCGDEDDQPLAARFAPVPLPVALVA